LKLTNLHLTAEIVSFLFFNPNFAIEASTEASEAEAFVTEKAKAMQGHRLSFLRIQKSGIARRIPLSIAKSGLKVVLISWGIAFVEYCFQVPANRIGHYQFSAAQLKTIQEIITLVIFAVFSFFYLKEDFRWNYLVSFLMIIGATFFMFKKW